MDAEALKALAHLRRAKDLMDRNYAEPLDVPALAQRASMSPAHFSREFKRAYGETPHSYLLTRRIERAMHLLRASVSVTDACMQVGWTSLGSFSTRFTEVVGETPPPTGNGIILPRSRSLPALPRSFCVPRDSEQF